MTDKFPGNSTQDGEPIRTYEFERLLIIGSGALTVAHLPAWAGWTTRHCPGLELKFLITRSASKFVSREALAVMTGSTCEIDQWPDSGPPTALHTELEGWADAIAVFPCSASFLAKVAGGFCDSPATMVVQTTSAAVGLAPSLPPGMNHSPIFQRNLETVRSCPNFVVPDLKPAFSASTGRMDAVGVGSWPDLLDAISKKTAELASTRRRPDNDG